ncbi:MAG: GntR family transcriptional regulator [Candidatus Aminicenantales bacterium]
MNLNFKLDKSAGASPAYSQIVQFIENSIRTDKLRPGDKLPPERELAEQLGTARGTIKKAYEELERKSLIEAAQGRGSFVSAGPVPSAGDRKERAVALIDNMIDQLVKLKFSYQEIRIFFDLRLLGREEALQNLAIATVDCNPEALAIYEKQIFVIPYVNNAKFLLDDLFRDPAAGRRLGEFDLILTTPTHFHDLLARFPEIQDKTLQVAVSPTRESIIRLARLTPSQKIGVICESARFSTIISNHLKAFDILPENAAVLYFSEIERLDEFVRDKNVLIVPPGFALLQSRAHAASIQAFTEQGGTVIPFDYKIERGSLLHVEERIRMLLDAAGRG